MQYLFIIGPSGSGKSTLATKIAEIKPEKFKRLTQCTTRPKRQNEQEGVEYNFLTPKQYSELYQENKLIAAVVEEFSPASYGTSKDQLDPNRINIIIVSIEGLLHALKNTDKKEDKVHVLFIHSVEEPEAKRKNRSFHEEEKYSSIVLNNIEQNFNLIKISHSHLKQIRDIDTKLNRFLCLNGVKFKKD
jgi:guanylate kinase